MYDPSGAALRCPHDTAFVTVPFVVQTPIDGYDNNITKRRTACVPLHLMHITFFAPELSATSNTVCC
jgi:hypothetical protein